MKLLPSQSILKLLAWVEIAAGAVIHPTVYIFIVWHRIDPNRTYNENYIIPLDLFELIFGSLGWIASGISLLLILEIGTMLKKHLTQNKGE